MAETTGNDGWRNRRRVERVAPGPLRVRIHPAQQGVLVDLSALGALVQADGPQPVDARISLDIDCEGGVVRLHGRVVRSTPHRDTDRMVWGEPAEYRIAIEFQDVPAEAAESLRRLTSGGPA